jgi:hypothetical protein
MAIQKISGVTIDLDNQAAGDVTYFDGTDWVRLAKGDPEMVLTMNESETAPEWAVAVPTWTFPGTVKGYCATGNIVNSGHGEGPRAIERFSFTTDGNSTDVGDVTLGRHHSSGQSSDIDGYISGSAANGPVTSAIDRWSFASEGNAVDHGDLAIQSGQGAGQSSETHGYHTGGGISGSLPGTNHIQKFLFATSGTNNATDIADLTVARKPTAGASSSTHGYSAGGGEIPDNPTGSTIDKFPFATDSNATDVGDCDIPSSSHAGTSSLTHGYITGGTIGNNGGNIRKYSFTTDGNSTSIADLSTGRHAHTGCSSETFGYSAAGYNDGAYPPGQPNGATATIEKYAVATDSDATNVGDLASWKWAASPVGSQV